MAFWPEESEEEDLSSRFQKREEPSLTSRSKLSLSFTQAQTKLDRLVNRTSDLSLSFLPLRAELRRDGSRNGAKTCAGYSGKRDGKSRETQVSDKYITPSMSSGSDISISVRIRLSVFQCAASLRYSE